MFWLHHIKIARYLAQNDALQHGNNTMPQVGIVATDGTSGPQILVCQRGTGRRGRLDKWFKRDLKYKPVSLKLMELIGCTHLAHLQHGEILGKLHL